MFLFVYFPSKNVFSFIFWGFLFYVLCMFFMSEGWNNQLLRNGHTVLKSLPKNPSKRYENYYITGA